MAHPIPRSKLDLMKQGGPASPGMARQTLMGLAHCTRLRALNLACCAGVGDSLLAVVAASCKGLERLDVSGCDVTDSGVISLAHHCHDLKELLVSECRLVTDASIQQIAERCRLLEQLVVANTRVADAGIFAIAQCSTNLRHLDVQGCSHVTHASISVIAAHGPGLQHLSIHGLRHLRDDSIIAIAEGCPGLTGIDLSGCVAITADGMRALADRCPQLQHVSVAGILYASAGLQQMVSRCARLRHLDAREVITFDDAISRALGSNCPDLRHLAVGMTLDLTDAGIIALAQGCPLLEHLRINACPRVTDGGLGIIAIHCPRLRHLDIRDCTNVTDAGVALVSQHCRELEELSMGMWGFRMTDASLRTVARFCAKLRCFNLRHGDLGNGGAPAVLEHRGGQLEALDVSGTRYRLEELSQMIGRTCTRLRSLWMGWCSALSDAHVASLLSGPAAGGLLHLDISKSGSEVTDKSLFAIGGACPQLCSLNVHSCHGVTDEGMKAIAAGCRRLIIVNAMGTSTTVGVYGIFAGSDCTVMWWDELCLGDPVSPPYEGLI
eukprot:jgi/Mesvir1/12584/Mv10332-RA.1